MAKKQSDLVAPKPDAVPAVVVSAAMTETNAMIKLAITEKVPVDTMERLVALAERMTDRAAASEFAGALAAFQGECPSIAKTSTANIPGASGGGFSYKYAELDQIVATIRPLLHRRGLSYSWDCKLDGQLLNCMCTLRHVNGHSVTATFTSPTESKAGMSPQQKVASALTFARRQSLVQVLGLTTCDPDTDAALGSPEPITPGQVSNLEAFVRDSGASLTGFLKYMDVASLADIQSRNYESAVTALNQKKRAAAGMQNEPSMMEEGQLTTKEYDLLAAKNKR